MPQPKAKPRRIASLSRRYEPLLGWFRNARDRSTAPKAGGRPPTLPAGERVYAVGDIHGRSDLLAEIEERIRQDAQKRPPKGPVTIVYLGDYIDRGRDSRGVVERLISLTNDRFQRRYLLGNHDWWLRQFLTGATPGHAWMQSGGDRTLQSYGVDGLALLDGPDAVERLRRRLMRRVPPAHHRFLGALLPMHRQGDYLFTHAGIRPGLALDQQQLHDLIFIREPFLSDASDFGVVVVHGHTVVEEPTLRCNRIGIDTGAYWTGRLTVAVLEGTDIRFLSTGAEP